MFEEYKMLATKEHHATRRIEELERNVVIACSAIYVFSLVTFRSQQKIHIIILFSLPFLVSLVGFYRYWGLARYVEEIDHYALKLERELSSGVYGWLSYYYECPLYDAKDHHGFPRRSDGYFRRHRDFAWYAIMFVNFVAGIILILPALGLVPWLSK
jgi:Ca2+/Na+ antiporter